MISMYHLPKRSGKKPPSNSFWKSPKTCWILSSYKKQ